MPASSASPGAGSASPPPARHGTQPDDPANGRATANQSPATCTSRPATGVARRDVPPTASRAASGEPAAPSRAAGSRCALAPAGARCAAGSALTPREREVLAWVAAGKTNRDIGAILGASPRTVEKHLERIYEKLGVETRTAAAMRSIMSPPAAYRPSEPGGSGQEVPDAARRAT